MTTTEPGKNMNLLQGTDMSRERIPSELSDLEHFGKIFP
jgi:hypothetical protein